MNEATETQQSSAPDPAQNPDQNPAMPGDWPLRPWVLAGLLALAALGVYLASDGVGGDVPWRMALSAFFFFAGGVAAFTLDRDYLIPPAIFAGISGLVMAGIAWRASSGSDYHSDTGFWVAAGVLAVTLSLPLFQAGFHRKRFQTSYADAHYFVWTDALSGAGALAFTGLSWGVVALLASLFELLQITLLSDLMDQEWFGWMFSGAAFGAALGVLRNQIKVLATLQSVVLLVLSLLAVPLAVALVMFLLAMIVSGPDVLWEATRSATPVLLGCAVGAFVLTNAVIRDDDDDMTKSKIQRWAALVLALGIFPLTVFAAVSMGTRIAQYGLSPERIWALVAIIVATTFGVAYAVSVIRGRLAGWRDSLRQSNLHLAALVAVVAFVLAMPVFDFGAVSTRDQLARLKSGVVSVEDFDFSALRWDFGEAGREALAELAGSGDAETARLAKLAQREEYRPYRGRVEETDERDERLANLRFQFEEQDLRQAVQDSIANSPWQCQNPCVAVEIRRDGSRVDIALLEQRGLRNLTVDLAEAAPEDAAAPKVGHVVEAVEAGAGSKGEVKANSEVEIREWTGRRIYVDGQPIGDPFE